MRYTSIHGRRFGFSPNGLLFNMMPVGEVRGHGKDFYVDSVTGAAGSSGLNPDEAISTLDAAVAKCTANQGDRIIVMPNHAETVTGVGGITLDVAGISVIGLGRGNQRPRFLMDGATTVTVVVSAADVTVQNLVFAAGHADIVRLFNITAAGFTAIECEAVENTTAENFLTMFDASSTTNNNADLMTLIGNRFLGVDAAALNFLEVNADLDGLVCERNLVVQSGGTDSALIKCATGKDLTNCSVLWNFVQHAMTANDLLIDNDTTANTGIVAHNRCKHKDVTSTHSLIDCDGVGLFDNLSTSVDTASGFVLPAIDTDA